MAAICGLLFTAAWMLPTMLLMPEGRGPLQLGKTYAVGVVALQIIAFMPVLPSFPAVALRVLQDNPDS